MDTQFAIPEKLPNRLETMGLTATLSPFVCFDSSSRVQMLASHISQTVVPFQSDIPRSMTGFETQLAEYTFNITMPVDGIVISVHKKYFGDLSHNPNMKNPLITIIYQNQENGEYDYIDIHEYHSKHKIFGCQFIINPIVDKIRPGSAIPKGTLLAHSPSIKEGGIYSSSIEANVAYLSLPGTIEDGFVVSESFCEKGAPLEISHSVAEWGRKTYPLNLYGDEHNYKPFPDIGDKIRPDGLVFALREYNSQFDAIEMNNKALMKVDMIHDIRIYGIPGAEVYDVQVESGIGENRNRPLTPKGIELQPLRYINQTSNYYAGIKNTYDKLVRENVRGIGISPRLQILITQAIADKPNLNAVSNANGTGIVRRTYKNVPLDEYRVLIRYKNRKKLKLGSKITNLHGGG